MTRQVVRFAAVALAALTAHVCAAFVAPSTSSVARSAWGCSSAEQQQRLPSFALSAVMLDREDDDVKIGGPAGPAVLDRPDTKTADPTKQRQRQGGEAWEVRIYNDGMNTREHVARSLVQVTGMSEISAYSTMMNAHQNGMAVVGRYVFEIAEMYHNALKKNGIICDIVPVDEDK